MPRNLGYSLGSEALGFGLGGGDVSGVPLPTLATLTIMGDSIANGVDASTVEARWVSIAAVSMGNATVNNQAISGTVLQNSNGSGGSPLTNNGRDTFYTRCCGANKRDGVIFAYGFNDSRYTAAPATFNVAQYKADYREIMFGLLENEYVPNRIFVAAPYYITDTGLATGSAGFTGQTRSGFEAFVTAASEVADEFGTYYYDAYAYMRDNGGASLIGPDNIHPQDPGMAAIAAGFINRNSVPNARAAVVFTATRTASTTVQLAITPATGAVDYELNWSASNALAFTNSSTTSSLSPSLTVPAGEVSVVVRANYGSGAYGPWSMVAYVSPFYTPPAGAFLVDQFSGRLQQPITAHAPNVGGTWVAQSGVTPTLPAIMTGQGRMLSLATSDVYRNTAIPPNANYYVEADFDTLSVIAGENIGITGRAQSSTNTYYTWRYNNTVGGWQLLRINNGTATQLGTDLADAWTTGSRTARLEMNGTTITGTVVGVAGSVSVTDSSISTAGYAGVRMATSQTSTTGRHMQRLIAVPL